jgi:hypothetical protein
MSAGRGHNLKRLERNMFLHFSDILADVVDFLTLQDMNNMPTLSINIKIISIAAKQQITIMFCYNVSKALTNEFTFFSDLCNGV